MNRNWILFANFLVFVIVFCNQNVHYLNEVCLVQNQLLKCVWKGEGTYKVRGEAAISEYEAVKTVEFNRLQNSILDTKYIRGVKSVFYSMSPYDQLHTCEHLINLKTQVQIIFDASSETCYPLSETTVSISSKASEIIDREPESPLTKSKTQTLPQTPKTQTPNTQTPNTQTPDTQAPIPVSHTHTELIEYKTLIIIVILISLMIIFEIKRWLKSVPMDHMNQNQRGGPRRRRARLPTRVLPVRNRRPPQRLTYTQNQKAVLK